MTEKHECVAMEVDQDEEGCDKDDNKERYEETKGDVAGEVGGDESEKN